MYTEAKIKKVVDRYALVAFEGPPTSGKTMLARRFSQAFSRRLLLEPTGGMLYWFHQDRAERGFTTQAYFLAHRMEQAKVISRLISNGEKVCQDYAIWKDVVYAQTFLSKREYKIYRRLYRLLESVVTPPNLLVILKCHPDVIMGRLYTRKRKGEASLGIKEIRHISKNTMSLASKSSCPKIVMDTTDFGVRFSSKSRDRLFTMVINGILELDGC